MNQPRESKPQFIRIDRGISQFNHDYYAALGLPINSSPTYIRHVYLSVARILHPDIYGFSAEEKDIATQYLAKLVNPAYSVLMKEGERNAYQGIFKLLAKRLMQKSRNLPIYSPIACELMMTPSDGFYERSVSVIAKLQYQSLTTILEYTAQISELNLVYILYKDGYKYGAANMPPVLMPMSPPKDTDTNPPSHATPTVKPSYNSQYLSYQPPNNQQADCDETVFQTRIEADHVDLIADRLKICEIYISQGNWKAAMSDLREILLFDQKNSQGHAMLGVVYKNINQPQMAKVSLMRSLQLNPQDPLALKHINDLSNPNQSSTTSKNNNNKSATKPNSKVLVPIQQTPQRSWLFSLLGWISNNDNKTK